MPCPSAPSFPPSVNPSVTAVQPASSAAAPAKRPRHPARGWSALAAITALSWGLASTAVQAQAAPAYPSKPVRVVVGFPAGSTTDAIARVAADQLSKALGQPFVVENKPGANGMLGVGEVARAQPDGHTLLVTNSSSITINPQIYKKAGYKPSDFAPVSQFIDAPFFLVANADWAKANRVNTVADLLNWGKANPGKLSYGSAGPGNIAHLSWAKLSNARQLDTVHVPYKSLALAQQSMLAGDFPTLFDTPPVITHVQSGKVKALAVTAPKRWPALPDVPTMAEAGVPDFNVSFWIGMLAPAGTPQPVIDRLYAAIQKIPDHAGARNALAMQGEVLMSTPADFARHIAQEVPLWGAVIQRERISID